MSSGILLFAENNREIDYLKLAIVSATLVKKYLSVPVSVVTDKGSLEWAKKNYLRQLAVFDKVIIPDDPMAVYQDRRFYDGTLSYKKANFNNLSRSAAYMYTPYDKTLVLDTDVLINNAHLTSIWDTDFSFMINSDHKDLSTERSLLEFDRISDTSIKFYWATAFFFKKDEWSKTFFELCHHIAEEYEYYRFVYNIKTPLYRNDYVFSIALHIMNGFEDINVPNLPAKFHYCIDRDILWDVTDKNEFIFLIQKPEHLGEYSLVKTKNQNIHVMNKYSLLRLTDKLLEVNK